MTLQEAIAHHLETLQVRNYTPRTRINRAYQLRFLSRFLTEREPPVQEVESITGEILIEFQTWLYHQPTPKGTARGVANQNRIFTGVRGFFAFLKASGYLTANPADALASAREPRRLPRHVLTPQEARRILEAVDTGTAEGQRDRTILEVFYATGIRKQELLNLRVQNVSLEEELLRIDQGKGGRDRIVPLSRIACRFLETYLNAIRPALVQTARRTDRLFVSLRGKPLDKNVLSELVTHYAQAAKIKKHITCHIWRHTCATHLLKNRANLRHVQEILGHRSLATTERYLHLTISDLKEAHRRFHPREKEVD
jgi:integrase/recombinase XerD